MDSEKNVLVWYWGRKGGGAKETLEVARAMSEMENVNLYLSLCEENELFVDTKAFAIDSFNVSLFPNKPMLIINTLKLPLYRARFKKFLINSNIDTAYCTMEHFTTPFFAKVFKSLNIHYIFTVHDASNHPGEERKSYRKEIEENTSLADTVLVHSDSVKNSLINIYDVPAKKIVSLPIGAYKYNKDPQVRTLPTDRPIRLLFFGRIVKYKGLNIAIDAFKELRKKGYNVELEISGDGDISEYSKALSECDNVILNNRWINDSEIYDIFKRSDIVLLSYIEASQSGVVAIAVDMGVPVVATPVGGLAEQVNLIHCGIVSGEVSSISLCESVEYMIDNAQLYTNYSINEMKVAEGAYSWKNLLEKLFL